MAFLKKNPDDAVLIVDLLAGDEGALEQVRAWIRGALTPYRQSLAAHLEDLEQEVLLDLTRALREDRFQGQSRLRSHVRKYVHHKCIDQLRSRRRRQWVDVDDLELTSRAPSPLERLSDAETTELALRVVENMPEPCREIYRMLEQGMRYGEMSRRLGISEGNLRIRVFRCRQRALELRKRLLGERGSI